MNHASDKMNERSVARSRLDGRLVSIFTRPKCLLTGLLTVVLTLHVGCPHRHQEEEVGVVPSSDFRRLLEAFWKWKTSATELDVMASAASTVSYKMRVLKGFELVYAEAVVQDMWHEAIEVLASRGIGPTRIDRWSAGRVVASFSVQAVPPVSFARVAFEVPSDATVASSDDPIPEDEWERFPVPNPATTSAVWPKELLEDRFIRAGYGTRVRAWLVFSTILRGERVTVSFRPLAKRHLDGPTDAEWQRLFLFLEGIAAEPEACAEPIGAKHLLCAFASDDPDPAVWTLEFRDHARWLLDQLLISGDPCVNTRLPECLWDWDLHETFFGFGF